MLLQLSPDKRIKVIHSEVGFRHFCEELLVVGPGVVASFSSAEEENPLIEPFLFRPVVGLEHFRMIEAKDLVVVGMGKFVKDYVRVLGPSASGEKTSSTRHMHALFQGRVMPIGGQPSSGRVVLHARKLVLEINPDDELAQSLGFFRGQNVDDSLKVVGHRLLDVFQEFALFGFLECGVELDRPPFDFLDDRFGEFG